MDELMEEILKSALAKAKAETQRDLLSKLIKADVMTLENIAETFDMPLSEVQAIAGSINS